MPNQDSPENEDLGTPVTIYVETPSKEEIMRSISNSLLPIVKQATEAAVYRLFQEEFGGASMKPFAQDLFKTWLKSPTTNPEAKAAWAWTPFTPQAHEAPIPPLVTQEEALIGRFDEWLKQVVSGTGKQRRDYLILTILEEFPDLGAKLLEHAFRQAVSSPALGEMILATAELLKKAMPETETPTESPTP